MKKYDSVLQEDAVGSSRTYEIYQMKQNTRMRFLSLDSLKKQGVSIKKEEYDFVYKAPIESLNCSTNEEMDILEMIYIKFNTDHPIDFRGHSLSVSDVVVLQDRNQEKAYFCDSIAFQEIPEFFTLSENLQKETLDLEQHEMELGKERDKPCRLQNKQEIER